MMTSIWRVPAVIVLTVLISLPAMADGVLVFGGTGRLGSEVVKELLKVDEKVIVFARPTSDRARLEGLDVTYEIGDLLDQDSVIAAFESSRPRIVIDTAALYGNSYTDAIRNIVAGAKVTGVDQINLHGSVGAGDNMKLFPSIQGDALVNVLIDKGHAETALIESGLPYTIIRNGLIEYDDTLSSGNGRITEDRTVLGRITRVDLAAVSMQCFDEKECENKIYHATDDSLPVRLPNQEAE
jgi:uncharacterized protein YbjT (DUF2867 family)